VKIIVAQSAATKNSPANGHSEALHSVLVHAGHQVQQLDLPMLPSGDAAVLSLASHRLMNLPPWCDVILCLDPLSAVLQHPSKHIWLLNDHYLERSKELSPCRIATQLYVSNVLSRGIAEARSRFALSKRLLERLAAGGLTDATLLTPPLPGADRCKASAISARWKPLLREMGQ
jgi:hypothetical protein